MNVNKVFYGGHIVREPEVKYTSAGKAVCNLSVATFENYTDKASGDKRSVPCFMNCVAFGKTAETIANHLNKGDQILIEDGKISMNQWEDKNSNKRTDYKITINRFQFVGGRKKKSTNNSAPAPEPAPEPDEETPF